MQYTKKSLKHVHLLVVSKCYKLDRTFTDQVVIRWSSVDHRLPTACSVVVTNTVDWGSLDNLHFSHFWRLKKPIRVLADPGSGGIFFFALQMAIFLLYPHLVERERSPSHLSIRHHPTLRGKAISSSHHLPKVPPFNTITSEVRVST